MSVNNIRARCGETERETRKIDLENHTAAYCFGANCPVCAVACASVRFSSDFVIGLQTTLCASISVAQFRELRLDPRRAVPQEHRGVVVAAAACQTCERVCYCCCGRDLWVRLCTRVFLGGSFLPYTQNTHTDTHTRARVQVCSQKTQRIAGLPHALRSRPMCRHFSGIAVQTAADRCIAAQLRVKLAIW